MTAQRGDGTRRVLLRRLLDSYGPGSRGSVWTWNDELRWVLTHHARKQRRLERSIWRHGIEEPVLLGDDGRVWDGHHRVVAAIRLGLTHVPVVYGGGVP